MIKCNTDTIAADPKYWHLERVTRAEASFDQAAGMRKVRDKGSPWLVRVQLRRCHSVVGERSGESRPTQTGIRP